MVMSIVPQAPRSAAEMSEKIGEGIYSTNTSFAIWSFLNNRDRLRQTLLEQSHL